MTTPFTHSGDAVQARFWFEQLSRDIDVLDQVVAALRAPGGATPDPRLRARLEVTAEAVVGEFRRLWNQDPRPEGGPLVQ
ncbi:MAG: hypothetical protein ACRDJU_14620 [Actinomycetota bacterium]